MAAIVKGVLKTSTREAFDKVLAEAGFKIVPIEQASETVRQIAGDAIPPEKP